MVYIPYSPDQWAAIEKQFTLVTGQPVKKNMVREVGEWWATYSWTLITKKGE